MAPETATQYLRYRLSDGCGTNPQLDTSTYKRQIHALFVRWVRTHCHPKDFTVAVAHVCAVQVCSYLLAYPPGKPGPLAQAPAIHFVSLEPAPAKNACDADKPRHRFYNDEGDINPDVPLKALEQPLHELYCAWLASGWHPRDFEVFAADLAAEVAYELETITSLQGLGGCRSPEDYLSSPQKG